MLSDTDMDEVIFIYCCLLLLFLVTHRWYMYIITNIVYLIFNNMQLCLYLNVDIFFSIIVKEQE